MQENRFQVLVRDNCECQACARWPAGLIHENKPKRKSERGDLKYLNTLCGRCHMLISVVPDWIIVKVWKIELSNIALERKMVRGRVKRKIEMRNSS